MAERMAAMAAGAGGAWPGGGRQRARAGMRGTSGEKKAKKGDGCGCSTSGGKATAHCLHFNPPAGGRPTLPSRRPTRPRAS